MSILLDSASLDDAVRAAHLGFVRGITTNPALMRRETADPLRQIAELLRAIDFPEVYYQPTGAYGPLQHEAEKAFALHEERVILKLPATPGGAALASVMVRLGARVSLTAAQAPHAMTVAESIGCVAVIPYVDRALRDLRIDARLIRSLAQVRRGSTRIVAASVKNAGQFVQAYQDGADAVTAPLAVLDDLLRHPAGLEAERDFAAEYPSD
jgi:transaldolase